MECRNMTMPYRLLSAGVCRNPFDRQINFDEALRVSLHEFVLLLRSVQNRFRAYMVMFYLDERLPVERVGFLNNFNPGARAEIKDNKEQKVFADPLRCPVLFGRKSTSPDRHSALNFDESNFNCSLRVLG